MTEEEERVFGRDSRVVVCTSRVAKMKKHLSFCREFNLFCIEERAVVDHGV